MKTAPLLWALALVIGALIPVQAAANAALSPSILGNVAASTLTLFAVAAATTIVAFGLMDGPVPTWAQFRAAPWWSFTGGLIVSGRWRHAAFHDSPLEAE
jgi:transporter family-2 protein